MEDRTLLEAVRDFELPTRKGPVQVKSGTTISVNHVYANRDPKFFGVTGQDFNPRRFLGAKVEGAEGLIVTSGGPDIVPVSVKDRRCPAQEFSVAFLKKLLQFMMRGYAWELSIPQPTWDYNDWNIGWHPMKFSLRLNSFKAKSDWVQA
jgi:cytochrome P450